MELEFMTTSILFCEFQMKQQKTTSYVTDRIRTVYNL